MKIKFTELYSMLLVLPIENRVPLQPLLALCRDRISEAYLDDQVSDPNMMLSPEEVQMVFEHREEMRKRNVIQQK